VKQAGDWRDPRGRPDYRDRRRGERRQCHSVPLGAPVRRLAWSSTAAALERRQGAVGHISKRGDGYIKRLLVHGARAHLSWSRRKKQIRSAWLTGLLSRRPTNVVLLAMANKTARTAWAMLSRGERYQEVIAAAA
jgi:transposase